MSKRFRKQSHTIYECKYHLIFWTKYRYRVLTDEVREYAREAIGILVKQKEELEILELNVQPDHVHLLLWIPPKYSVASVMGYLKGKLAIRILQRYEKLGKKYWGRHLWSRGYPYQHNRNRRRANPRIREMAGKEGAGNGTVARRVVR